MIAKLTGVLEGFRGDAAVIDVGGVGYLIFASSRTLAQLGDVGTSISVAVETQVREDYIHLYGFASEAERRSFQVLQTVQGVGARAALSILSALAPEEVAQSIVAGDKAMLTRAAGVGPKLATRIISELKDKLAGWPLGSDESDGGAISGGGGAGGSAGGKVSEDAISALVNLGYGRADAYKAVLAAAGALGDEAPLDQVVTASLKELAS